MLTLPRSDLSKLQERNVIFEMIEKFKSDLEKLLHREKHSFGGESQSVAKIADLILQLAADLRASDLHTDPVDEGLRIRYRIDGYLHELHRPLPKEIANNFIARIKIMAKMDSTTNFSPADGSFKFGKIEMRVAAMPSLGAESLTIRLMDIAQNLQNINDLGFTPENEKIFRRFMDSSSGMVILTGPMNSGKSTTLYAALRELNSPARAIMTLEDPIERHIDGIGQVQVNEKTGLTFAAGLRAMLRMDCNCMMIGEIRDSETAQIAVRAALTGHLILTTLHAGDSCNALFRLPEMGVESHLIAATLKGIVAQRLVRRLCPDCKKISEPSPEEIKFIGNQKVYKPVGCEKCRGTGYFGRIALQEILRIDREIQKLILTSRDIEEIRTAALKSGMKTLADDAKEKILAGLTTFEEVRHVLE